MSKCHNNQLETVMKLYWSMVTLAKKATQECVDGECRCVCVEARDINKLKESDLESLVW